MGTVTLHPDRITARWYSEEETVRPASTQELSRYFFYTVTLDPHFTLGDLLVLLDQEDVALLEMVLGERVEPVLEEARSAAPPRMPPSGPDLPSRYEPGPRQTAASLPMPASRQTSDAPPLAEPTPGRPEFLRVCNVHADGSLRRDFDGWGPWAEPWEGAWEEHPDWPRVGPFGLSLTPLGELLHLPLRYDPELIFRDPDGTEEYRTTIDITLIDFLKAVFFELTFHGTPEERNRMWGELRSRMEDVESGRVRSIPAEELFRGLREGMSGGRGQEEDGE